MPTPEELVAHERSVEEIRQIIGCDALIYQEVNAMREAVSRSALAGSPEVEGFDASCFDGVYITGDITAADIARLNQQRVNTEEDAEDNSRLALPNANQ
jgi:amidophosphoribosyltransferase